MVYKKYRTIPYKPYKFFEKAQYHGVFKLIKMYGMKMIPYNTVQNE